MDTTHIPNTLLTCEVLFAANGGGGGINTWDFIAEMRKNKLQDYASTINIVLQHAHILIYQVYF